MAEHLHIKIMNTKPNIYLYQDTLQYKLAVMDAATHQGKVIQVSPRDNHLNMGWKSISLDACLWNWQENKYRIRTEYVNLYEYQDNDEYRAALQLAYEAGKVNIECKNGPSCSYQGDWSKNISPVWNWDKVMYRAISPEKESSPIDIYAESGGISKEFQKEFQRAMDNKEFDVFEWQDYYGCWIRDEVREGRHISSFYWPKIKSLRAIKKKESLYCPYTYDSFPKGNIWMKFFEMDKTNSERLVTEVRSNGIFIGTIFIHYENLVDKYISLDGRLTWQLGFYYSINK